MFILKCNSYSRSAKKTYIYHKLLETYRSAVGPRHRTIFNLGTLDLEKKQWKTLAKAIESRLLGLQELLPDEDERIKNLADKYTEQILTKRKIKSEKKKITEKSSDLENIHTDTIEVTNCRSYGAEVAGYEYMKLIGLEKIIEGLDLKKSEKQIIKALVISRLVHPASENETYRWLRCNSGLGEILNIDFNDIGIDRLYRTCDKILENKKVIEESLAQAERRNLKLESKLILYDLTNTFLEGGGESNKYAKYGRSKEKRSDCPLITLALAVDENGYPITSKIYKGNESEAGTVKEIIEEIYKEKPELKLFQNTNIIMDRGLATKKNIKFLEDKELKYVVIERRDAYSEWSEEFEKKQEFSEIDRKGYKIKIKKHSIGSINYLLCESEGKEKKELAIIAAKEKKFEIELEKIKQSLLKNKKTVETIKNQLSRLSGKYIGFYKLYNIKFIEDDKKNVTDLQWEKNDDYRVKKAGCYVIRTNNQSLQENEIWSVYMLLHKVENAFRTLKNDLLMRPIYHQKDTRAESHIFITILAYHILNCIEEKLNEKEETTNWLNIKMLLQTHQIVSVRYINDKNEMRIIRKSTLPEDHHREIYQHLDIDEQNIIRKKREVVCKI